MLNLNNRKNTYFFRAIAISLLFAFSCLVFVPAEFSNAYAQSLLNLPAPGSMVGVTSGYNPVMLQGMRVYPDKPLQFDFIMTQADEILEPDALRQEVKKLVHYFLSALTIPEDQLWVNLSPYEQDRIISESFAQTQMGHDLLAQDYILKQLTASLIYPEDDLGREFWQKVYKACYEKYGTTEMPLETFHKVWIVPETAVVYQGQDTVYVTQASLDVLLEKDYLAYQKNSKTTEEEFAKADPDDIATRMIREIVLPEIKHEINFGKNFAQLRQIFNAVILSSWFKDAMKNSFLNHYYSNKSKTSGIELNEQGAVEIIYDRYLEAFRAGVYNYVRVEHDPFTGRHLPRKYFSGGTDFALTAKGMPQRTSDFAQVTAGNQDAFLSRVDLKGVIDRPFLEAEQNLRQMIIGVKPEDVDGNVQEIGFLKEMIENIYRLVKGKDIERMTLTFPREISLRELVLDFTSEENRNKILVDLWKIVEQTDDSFRYDPEGKVKNHIRIFSPAQDKKGFTARVLTISIEKKNTQDLISDYEQNHYEDGYENYLRQDTLGNLYLMSMWLLRMTKMLEKEKVDPKRSGDRYAVDNEGFFYGRVYDEEARNSLFPDAEKPTIFVSLDTFFGLSDDPSGKRRLHQMLNKAELILTTLKELKQKGFRLVLFSKANESNVRVHFLRKNKDQWGTLFDLIILSDAFESPTSEEIGELYPKQIQSEIEKFYNENPSYFDVSTFGEKTYIFQNQEFRNQQEFTEITDQPSSVISWDFVRPRESYPQTLSQRILDRIRDIDQAREDQESQSNIREMQEGREALKQQKRQHYNNIREMTAIYEAEAELTEKILDLIFTENPQLKEEYEQKLSEYFKAAGEDVEDDWMGVISYLLLFQIKRLAIYYDKTFEEYADLLIKDDPGFDVKEAKKEIVEILEHYLGAETKESKKYSSSLKSWKQPFASFLDSHITSQWESFTQDQQKKPQLEITLVFSHHGFLAADVGNVIYQKLSDFYKNTKLDQKQWNTFDQWLNLWDIKIHSFSSSLIDSMKIIDAVGFGKKLVSADIQDWIYPVAHGYNPKIISDSEVLTFIRSNAVFYLMEPDNFPTTFHMMSHLTKITNSFQDPLSERLVIANLFNDPSDQAVNTVALLLGQEEKALLTGQAAFKKAKELLLQREIQREDLIKILPYLFTLFLTSIEDDEAIKDILKPYTQFDTFQKLTSSLGVEARTHARVSDRSIRLAAHFLLGQFFGQIARDGSLKQSLDPDIVIFKQRLSTRDSHDQARLPVLEFVSSGVFSAAVAVSLSEEEPFSSLDAHAASVLEQYGPLDGAIDLLMEEPLLKSIYDFLEPLQESVGVFHPGKYIQQVLRYKDQKNNVFSYDQIQHQDSLDKSGFTVFIQKQELLNLMLVDLQKILEQSMNFGAQRYFPLFQQILNQRSLFYQKHQSFPIIHVASNGDSFPRDVLIPGEELEAKELLKILLRVGLHETLPFNSQIIETLIIEKILSMIDSSDREVKVTELVDRENLLKALVSDQLNLIFMIHNRSKSSVELQNKIAEDLAKDEVKVQGFLEKVFAIQAGSFEEIVASITQWLADQGIIDSYDIELAFGADPRKEKSPYFKDKNIEFQVAQDELSFYFKHNEKRIAYPMTVNEPTVRKEFSAGHLVRELAPGSKDRKYNREVMELAIILERAIVKIIEHYRQEQSSLVSEIEKAFEKEAVFKPWSYSLLDLYDKIKEANPFFSQQESNSEIVQLEEFLEQGLSLFYKLVDERNSSWVDLEQFLDYRNNMISYLEKIKDKDVEPKVHFYILASEARNLDSSFKQMIEGFLKAHKNSQANVYVISDSDAGSPEERTDLLIDPELESKLRIIHQAPGLALSNIQSDLGVLHVGLGYHKIDNPERDNVICFLKASGVQNFSWEHLPFIHASNELTLDLTHPEGAIPLDREFFQRAQQRHTRTLEELIGLRNDFLDQLPKPQTQSLFGITGHWGQEGKTFDPAKAIWTVAQYSNAKKFLEEMRLLAEQSKDIDQFFGDKNEEGHQVLMHLLSSEEQDRKIKLSELIELGFSVVFPDGQVFSAESGQKVPVTVLLYDENSLNEDQIKTLIADLIGTTEKDDDSGLFVDFPSYVSGMGQLFWWFLSSGRIFSHEASIETGSYMYQFFRRALLLLDEDMNKHFTQSKMDFDKIVKLSQRLNAKAGVLSADWMSGQQSKSARFETPGTEFLAISFPELSFLKQGKYKNLFDRTRYAQELFQLMNEFLNVADDITVLAALHSSKDNAMLSSASSSENKPQEYFIQKIKDLKLDNRFFDKKFLDLISQAGRPSVLFDYLVDYFHKMIDIDHSRNSLFLKYEFIEKILLKIPGVFFYVSENLLDLAKKNAGGKVRVDEELFFSIIDRAGDNTASALRAFSDLEQIIHDKELRDNMSLDRLKQLSRIQNDPRRVDDVFKLTRTFLKHGSLDEGNFNSLLALLADKQQQIYPNAETIAATDYFELYSDFVFEQALPASLMSPSWIYSLRNNEFLQQRTQGLLEILDDLRQYIKVLYELKDPNEFRDQQTKDHFAMLLSVSFPELSLLLPAQGKDLHGGIDFNNSNFLIERQGQDIDFSMPAGWSAMELREIQGFTPVILFIVPLINLQGFVQGPQSQDFLVAQDSQSF